MMMFSTTALLVHASYLINSESGVTGIFSLLRSIVFIITNYLENKINHSKHPYLVKTFNVITNITSSDYPLPPIIPLVLLKPTLTFHKLL